MNKLDDLTTALWESAKAYPGGAVVYEPMPDRDAYWVIYRHPTAGDFIRGFVSQFERVQLDRSYSERSQRLRSKSDSGGAGTGGEVMGLVERAEKMIHWLNARGVDGITVESQMGLLQELVSRLKKAERVCAILDSQWNAGPHNDDSCLAALEDWVAEKSR